MHSPPTHSVVVRLEKPQRMLLIPAHRRFLACLPLPTRIYIVGTMTLKFSRWLRHVRHRAQLFLRFNPTIQTLAWPASDRTLNPNPNINIKAEAGSERLP